MPDFSTVTEAPGHLATRDQMSMMLTRYSWAASHCAGKKVLELGCGTGTGLGYLAKTASEVG